jgi:hypothetical protein
MATGLFFVIGKSFGLRGGISHKEVMMEINLHNFIYLVIGVLYILLALYK